MLAHVLADLRPDGQENALTLVVTGTVLVRQAKVAGDDRSVDRRDDRAQGDLLWRACQDVAAADAALGADQASAFQRQEDLLQIGLGESGSLRDVTHRGWAALLLTQCQREQRPTGVVAASRYLHTYMVGRR